jgi:hypothetical protein
LSSVTICLNKVNGCYRPPPAQAQAQPAQAQAQAQERPPPPPRLPVEPVGLGTGLVTLVTRLVKSLTFPITFWEKVCMPPATEDAKSEPGKRGTDGIEGVEEEEEPCEICREKEGS